MHLFARILAFCVWGCIIVLFFLVVAWFSLKGNIYTVDLKKAYWGLFRSN